jgi:hypothetical protein
LTAIGGEYIVMKDLIALLFTMGFAIAAIILCIKKKVNNIITISILFFSITLGFVISNHDVIKRLKLKEVEIETYERQVVDIKNKAIDEIKGEISVQKKSIEKVIADAKTLKNQFELISYREVSGYSVFGRKYGSINGVPMGRTPIDDWSQEFVDRHKGKIICKCSPLAIDKCRYIIEKMPLYPFSYYFLAICLKEKGDRSWKDYANKAKSILEKTTQFPSHHSDHDEILQEINKLIERPEK